MPTIAPTTGQDLDLVVLRSVNICLISPPNDQAAEVAVGGTCLSGSREATGLIKAEGPTPRVREQPSKGRPRRCLGGCTPGGLPACTGCLAYFWRVQGREWRGSRHLAGVQSPTKPARGHRVQGQRVCRVSRIPVKGGFTGTEVGVVALHTPCSEAAGEAIPACD